MRRVSRHSNRPGQAAVKLAALFFLSLWTPVLLLPAAAKSLKKIATIELPGPLGKPFDALAIDSENHRLFCAHTGANALYVVDLETNQLTQTISGLPGVRSVLYLPESRKIYASVAGDDSIVVIDGTSFEITRRIPTESAPAAMALAAPQGKIFVSDELARAVVVIDAAREIVLSVLRFESRTGTLQYDSVAKKIYLNLPDANQLAVIDPESGAVTAKFAVGRCAGNSGMALDAGRRLAFLSCEGNNLLAIFDLRANVPEGYLPMAAGGAGVALDPKLGRVYVACASGAIAVYEDKDTQKCRRLGDISAAYAVHSLAVDENTQRLYVPLQQEDGVPVSQLEVYQEQP